MKTIIAWISLLLAMVSLVLAQSATQPERALAPEDVIREVPTNEVTVVFRVADVYWISGSVPVGSEPSFGLAPSANGNTRSRFSVLIAGQLVNDAKRFGVEPMNPSRFFKERVVEVKGTVQKFNAPKDRPDTKPSFQLVVSKLENFRIIE